jgi:hypothetical protein
MSIGKACCKPSPFFAIRTGWYYSLHSLCRRATPRSPSKEGIYGKELEEGMDAKGHWKYEMSTEDVMEETVQII